MDRCSVTHSETFVFIFPIGFPEVQEPSLVVSLEQGEAVFHCQFARLADFEVQYSVSYYGDGNLLSEHLVGDSIPALTEMEIDELQYGSQVS